MTNNIPLKYWKFICLHLLLSSLLFASCSSVKKDEANNSSFLSEVACKKGNLDECFTFANELSKSKKHERAYSVMAKNCLSDHYNSCLFIGPFYREKGESDYPVEFLRFFEKGCADGNGDKCLPLADYYFEFKKNKKKGFELLSYSCKRNSLNACMRVKTEPFLSSRDDYCKSKNEEDRIRAIDEGRKLYKWLNIKKGTKLPIKEESYIEMIRWLIQDLERKYCFDTR